jgi:hypothetical protein
MRLQSPGYRRRRLFTPGLALKFSLAVVLAQMVTSCATMTADKTADKTADDEKGFRFFQRRF